MSLKITNPVYLGLLGQLVMQMVDIPKSPQDNTMDKQAAPVTGIKSVLRQKDAVGSKETQSCDAAKHKVVLLLNKKPQESEFLHKDLPATKAQPIGSRHRT